MGFSKNKSKIKDYMQGVRDFLQNEYGEVKSEWEITLIMLEDNLNLYEEIKQSIKDNGIYSVTRGVKNPLLSTMKDTQATILKISQKLGISPWDSSKIKQAPVDDVNDFVESLMEGGDDE